MKDGYAGLSWGFPRRSYFFWAVLRLSGVLLGLSWASLGPSWPLMGLSLALAKLSRCSLGLSWSLLGGSGGSLEGVLASLWRLLDLGPLSQEAARQQESGPRECKEPPKRFPREPKRSPKKLFFRVLFGASFWTLFGTPLQRVSWTLGLCKTRISLGRSYKNAASPRSPPRAKNDRHSSKDGTQN